MDLDPKYPLPLRHKSSYRALIQEYFHLEVEFMPAPGYSKQKKFIDIRAIAMLHIEKFTSDQADLLVIFLPITFFDRFLSRNLNIPVVKSGEGFESNLKLFVFCCVSIACKLRCSDFSFRDFLNKHQVGDVADVTEMELQILEGLRWRVRPLTAITFAYYLLPFVKSEDQPEWLLIGPLCRIIVGIQRDIRFTEFRHSTLAASAILVTSYKLLPGLHSEIYRKVFRCGFIQQYEVQRCFDELKEHPLADYIINPDKNPLDQFKQRFRRPGCREKEKGLMIHKPVARTSRITEIVELEEEEQVPEEEIEMEPEPEPAPEPAPTPTPTPDPNSVEPVEERRYNPFQRILITCFLPIVCRCLGYEIRRRTDP